MEDVYDPLKKKTASIGLMLNSTKMKYMIPGEDRGTPSGVNADIVFDGEVF